jgi:ATP-dependent RNA helicase RhlE
MKFSEYNFTPEIIKNLEMMGFKKPTDIQYKSIPAIVKGEDLLAIAQTGTGKTAAFAIPIINYIQRKKKEQQRKCNSCFGYGSYKRIGTTNCRSF